MAIIFVLLEQDEMRFFVGELTDTIFSLVPIGPVVSEETITM